MPDSVTTHIQITASGKDNQSKLATLAPGGMLRIGRAPKQGLAVPWDLKISREHADLQWANGVLDVECVETAANPVVWRGRPQRTAKIKAGDEFCIGDTTFRIDLVPVAPGTSKVAGLSTDDSVVVDESPAAGSDPLVAIVAAEVGDVEEYSYHVRDLKRYQFADPARQMELLTRVPDMIATAETDVELASMLAGLLLSAIQHAVGRGRRAVRRAPGCRAAGAPIGRSRVAEPDADARPHAGRFLRALRSQPPAAEQVAAQVGKHDAHLDRRRRRRVHRE